MKNQKFRDFTYIKRKGKFHLNEDGDIYFRPNATDKVVYRWFEKYDGFYIAQWKSEESLHVEPKYLKHIRKLMKYYRKTHDS